MSALTFTADTGGVTIRPDRPAQGFMGRLFGARTPQGLAELEQKDRALAFAMADAAAIAEELDAPDEARVEDGALRLSHRVVSRLPAEAAAALGLPPVTHLALHTDQQSNLGAADFRLSVHWTKGGRRVDAPRTGAIQTTMEGLRRLPAPMLEACEIAERFNASGLQGAHALEEHWSALGAFRRSLGEIEEEAGQGARVHMEPFLRGLRILAADALSVSPRATADGMDFDPVPFSRRSLARADVGAPAEMHAEISGAELHEFQANFRHRGALPAYRIGNDAYLAVDPSVRPALRVMALKQRAPAAERDAFVRSPRAAIAEAVEAERRAQGEFDGLSPEAAEEKLESLAEPLLIETPEYAARVIGKGLWTPPELDLGPATPTQWLPEIFDDESVARIRKLPVERLEALRDAVAEAVETGAPEVEAEGLRLPASPLATGSLDRLIAEKRAEAAAEGEEPGATGEEAAPGGRIILQTADNFEELAWKPDRGPRATVQPDVLPPEIVTPLMTHQNDSFAWGVAAWRAGLPGVLNADEQGLGKTLQTLSLLAWIRGAIKAGAEAGGPILIVAPTSLLQNWEREVETHMNEVGLGHLVKLYGGALGARKRSGARGMETEDGAARLDFDAIEEKIAKGRGHEHWVLTTYQTLTNYQHSLGRLKFAVAVFDEVQAVKNPACLRAAAARAVDADFRIGLTGTPVENRASDVWAIMDMLCPGALGSLRDFARTFRADDEEAMRRLHAALFQPAAGRPALGIRRMKSEAAKDLPAKERFLHPRRMPPVQAVKYDEARDALIGGSRGGALKALQHIRATSVHPALDGKGTDEDFIAASARLSAAIDVLDGLHERGERALVFIESIKMQHRFAALVRARYGLARVDIINGATPVEKRMGIVKRFQRHLSQDEGFDLLVLGPRAAGTGLTLTAATHVIHLSRWWNPAVEEQCNDRCHRIGQRKAVSIHVPMALHPEWAERSFDGLLQALMERKRRLAKTVLYPAGELPGDSAALQRGLSEARTAGAAPRFDDAALAASLKDQTRFASVERIAVGLHRLRSGAEGGGDLLLATEDAGDPGAALDQAMARAPGRVVSGFAISGALLPAAPSRPGLHLLDGPLCAAWPGLAVDEG